MRKKVVVLGLVTTKTSRARAAAALTQAEFGAQIQKILGA